MLPYPEHPEGTHPPKRYWVVPDLVLTFAAGMVVLAASFGANLRCTNAYSCGPSCPQCEHIGFAATFGLIVLAVQAVLIITRRRRLRRVVWITELLGVGVLLVVMFRY